MTVREFRSFYELLPNKSSQKGLTGLPSKTEFAHQCQLTVVFLNQVADGTRPLNKAALEKIVFAMKRYGQSASL